jgi:ABC-type sugar transport system permease subunit
MGTPSVMAANPDQRITRNWLRDAWNGLLGPRFAPYLFISPFFIMFLLFWVFPVFWSILLSFQRWSAKETTWVGLANYRFVLDSQAVRVSLRNMVWYAIGNNLFQLPLALFVAILLDLPLIRRASGWLRASYFMPNIVSGVTVGILFNILLGVGGVFNHFLPSILWLQSVEWSKPAVLLAGGWRWIGYWVVMFMAGLQGIPDEYYESADLDGATLWQRFSMITFPSLRPVFLFVIVVNTIGTLKIFEEPYMLFGTGSRGGPLNSATTPVLEMYKLGFMSFDLGSASALGWILALVIVAVSIVQFTLARRAGWSE